MAEFGAELLLALDTASASGSVAISRGEQLLGELVIDTTLTHNDRLLLQVDRLLRDLSLELADLDALVVVDGPGAFTGLRVGIANAKGLATALCKPLYGVSTLDVLAAGLPGLTLPVCALLDARKREVYAAIYTTIDGFPRQLVESCVLPPQELSTVVTGPTFFVGSGAVVYRESLVEQFGDSAHFAPWPLHAPRAAWAAALALLRFRNGEAPVAAACAPRYIRPPDAALPRLHQVIPGK